MHADATKLLSSKLREGALTARGLHKVSQGRAHRGRPHRRRAGARGARQRRAVPAHRTRQRWLRERGPPRGGLRRRAGFALPAWGRPPCAPSWPADPPSVAWSQGSFTGDVARIWQRHEEKGIEVCWQNGPVYPRRLVGDPEAPAVLFCQGDPVGDRPQSDRGDRGNTKSDPLRHRCGGAVRRRSGGHRSEHRLGPCTRDRRRRPRGSHGGGCAAHCGGGRGTGRSVSSASRPPLGPGGRAGSGVLGVSRRACAPRSGASPCATACWPCSATWWSWWRAATGAAPCTPSRPQPNGGSPSGPCPVRSAARRRRGRTACWPTGASRCARWRTS